MNKTVIQRKNILLGLTFKGISISLSFLIVPMLILFLGKTEYGVWVTVFSIINWIFTFDIGIGQGLRNKLTEALSVNNYKKASEIVATAYIFIIAFSIVIFLIGSLLIYFLNFQDILNYKEQTNSFLQKFVFLSLFFTVINFILSLYKKLYLSVHKSFSVEVINLFFQIFYLAVVLLWMFFELEKSLISLIIIFGLGNCIVAVIATIVFFKLQKKIAFSFYNFNFTEGKQLFGLGIKFFIINMCLLVILSTDNIIISKLLGPSFVTDYFTVQKAFQFLIVVFTVVLTSSWSLYSDAIINKDFIWIKKNFKKMNFYFLGILFFGFLIFCFIEDILNIWIGENVIKLPENLAFFNLIYVLLFCYTNIYMFFINASNRMNLQMYLYVFGAILNVPLSIFLVNYIGNSTGVILSTIICFLPLFILMPLQSHNIIKKLNETSLQS
ncbi:hypothetical protein [Polaribacter sp. Hel_I_88]|uniref:hypothetical protein n=1 Tax=Polaribacter sp. Hel_I_88 TaxID=1250006 RepID=UPI00047CCB4A|nr:hypothetical protein [Polaribacter sp. Hel_I_88]